MIRPVIKNLCFAFLLVAAGYGAAAAQSSYTSDHGLFRLDIYGKGESFSSAWLKKVAPVRQKSLHDLSSWQVTSLRNAIDYWDVLLTGSKRPDAPAIFATIVDDEENASAASISAIVKINGKKNIVSGPNSIINYGKHAKDSIDASVEIGSELFPSDMENESYKTPLPQYKAAHIAPTMVHEIGHAMGITTDSGQEKRGGIFSFDTKTSIFDSHLYDWRGVRAMPGMQIQTVGHKATSQTYFDLPGYWSSKGMKLPYFSGPNVQEVLDGAKLAVYNTLGHRTAQKPVPGLPINGNQAEDSTEEDDADLAHIELRNSLMSHQQWRNYLTFMEAELALLQDLGYTIDRRDYFGRSIYGDNGSIVNASPFFARNADGTAYLSNTYNRSMYGIGLHIYGSGNSIRQQANLFTKGIAGVGIRVDGTFNSVIVDKGVKIKADGLNGNGILVSYGKNHSVAIAQGASVRALGKGGIGAAFDFGTNMMGIAGEDSAERASYASRLGKAASSAAAVDVDGPLVKTFSVQGSLAGKKAAIHIGSGAYVQNIRIGGGASLRGPIVSQWMYSDDRLDHANASAYGSAMHRQYAGSGELTTMLSFEGSGLSYGGDIIGQDNMRFSVSGSLAYSGTAKVLSATVKKGGVLSGGTYNLMQDGVSGHRLSYSMNSVKKTLRGVGLFANHGMFGAGSSASPARVRGDLQSSGMIFARTDAKSSAGIAVSGTADVQGSAAIDLGSMPGETHTALTASSVKGKTSNGKSAPLAVSGMMNQYSYRQGNAVRVASVMSDNTGGSGHAFDAVALLYDSLPAGSAGREAMRPLFGLGASGARTALRSISSNAAAGSISLLQQDQLVPHILSARMHDVWNLREDRQKPVSHLWLKSGGRWGTLGNGAHYRGKYAAAGWDTSLGGGWRGGFLGSYGETDFSPFSADAELRSGRLGAYAGWQGPKSEVLLFADWSHAEHELKRGLRALGLRTKARYHSNMVEAGGEWKVTLAENQGWRLAPYAGALFSRIWQEAYKESGSGIFDQYVDAAALDQLSGFAGMELLYRFGQGGMALRAGGRHIFGGAQPKLAFRLAGDSKHAWLMENEQDRTFFTLSLDGGFRLPGGWELSGSGGLESGENSTHTRFSLLVLKKW